MPLTQSALLSGCLMGMPTTSVPIGDPQSNRNPQLSSGGYFDHTLLPEAQTFPKECDWARGLRRQGPLLFNWGSPFPLVPESIACVDSQALTLKKCTCLDLRSKKQQESSQPGPHSCDLELKTDVMLVIVHNTYTQEVYWDLQL